MLLEQVKKTVLFKQSFFGLPWVVIGAIFPYFLTASFSLYPDSSIPYLFVSLAFLSARFSGMAFNRLIDHFSDAKNPRTAGRPLPQGEMSRQSVAFIACGFLAFFFFSMSQINSLTFQLSPFIGILIVLYSFTKRFTWLCHFVLGFIQFFTHLCASVAAFGIFYWPSVYLGVSLAFCITANDILYACQDMEFDKREKLFSIPCCFGYKKAVFIAKSLHAFSVLSLVMFGMQCKLSAIYFMGPLCAGVLFFVTYRALLKMPLETIFTWSNISFSLAIMTSILGELLCRVL